METQEDPAEWYYATGTYATTGTHSTVVVTIDGASDLSQANIVRVTGWRPVPETDPDPDGEDA